MTVSKIFKDGLRTDQQTDRGDYIGPLWMNQGQWIHHISQKGWQSIQQSILSCFLSLISSWFNCRPINWVPSFLFLTSLPIYMYELSLLQLYRLLYSLSLTSRRLPSVAFTKFLSQGWGWPKWTMTELWPGKQEFKDSSGTQWNVWNVWNVWRHSLPRWHKGAFVLSICVNIVLFPTQRSFIFNICVNFVLFS